MNRVTSLLAFLAFNFQAQSEMVENITTSLGIVPFRLNPAYLKSDTHFIIHYAHLDPIISEYSKLSDIYMSLHNFSISHENLENYKNIISHYRSMINESITHLSHSVHKRGLIDGLGRTIKFITGNLDNTDGELINNALETIKKKELDLQYQMKHQYSINRNMILKFNKSIESIKFNEQQLIKRLDSLSRTVTSNTHDIHELRLENLFSQVLNSHVALWNLIETLEVSWSFCQLGYLHPTITTTHAISQQLINISNWYPDKLPPDSNSKLIKPTCTLSQNTIIYYVTVPLYGKEESRLYYLLPVPNNFRQIIIPPAHFALQDNHNTITLTNKCTRERQRYLCEIPSVTLNTACASDIINNNHAKGCLAVLVTPHSGLSHNTDIDRFILTAPYLTSLELQCEDTWDRHNLIGVYALRPDSRCQIYVNGTKAATSLHATVNATALHFNEIRVPRLDTRLPPIQLKDISLPDVAFQPPSEVDFDVPTKAHVSATGVLYVILFVVLCFLVGWCLKRNGFSPCCRRPQSRPL